ncbi:MAG TPA: hypothetical protein VIV11_36625 [Kofleriaceae bacterium]
MRTLLLASVLLFSACKKQDEAKPAEPSAVEKKEGDKPAETKPAETKPAEGTAPENKIVNANDYESKATDLTNKLLAIFVAGGKNCDKLAADLTKFIGDNKPLMESLTAFEKANPDAEKAFDQKMEAREKEMEEKIGPSFDACKDHAGLKTAMQSLPMN